MDTILLGTFDESKLNTGSITWKGQSFESIKSVYEERLESGIDVMKGYAYFSTSANNSKSECSSPINFVVL